MKIEIGDTRIRYCIEIYGKYSVIAGDSGCGKTTFFQLVQDYNDNPRLVKCNSELPVIAVDKRADEDVLGKYENHILVLDEDNRLLKKYNVATLFQQSPNYFILISRKNMNWIPLSIDNYYKLEYKNGINYNKSIFNRYQQLYFSGVNQIVTEDKESGSQLMLSIRFGTSEETMEDIDIAFNRLYQEEWMEDQFVKDMILDVDKSKVLDKYCIESPILGQIPPEKLSGGVKALILMYETDFEIWATACGDNCSKWILEIAKRKDITISLEHYMMFEDMHFSFWNVNKGVQEVYWDSIMKEAKFKSGTE